MGVGLHDKVHVDLNGLKLFAIMDVSVLGKFLCHDL
jgi:hypothetical protein